MASRSFIDTNVLVYCDDADEPGKQARALDLVARHRRDGTGVVSTQVLQEYFVVMTRRLRIDPEVAARKVQLAAGFDVVQVDVDMILDAIEVHRLHKLSFWDALVIQAARSGACAILLSEDMQAGSSVRGLQIVNPFAPQA